MLPRAILVQYSARAEELVDAVQARRDVPAVVAFVEAGLAEGADVAMDDAFADLDRSLIDFPADLPVQVFHIIDDLDQPEVVAVRHHDMLQIGDRVKTVMRRRFPGVRLHQWAVLRVGRELGEREIELLQDLAERKEFVTLVVTSGSTASAIDTDAVIVDRVADVIHAVNAGDGLAQMLADRGRTVFGIGCGAVRVEATAVADSSALGEMSGDLALLAGVTSADAGFVMGRSEVRGLKLDARPGSQADDPEHAALGSIGATGSAENEPAERIARLERDIDRLPPELWAGYIREAIDQTCATTGGIAVRRSPLARALDDVEQRSIERVVELADTFDERARTLINRTKSVPTLDQWCDGVTSALDEAATVLRTRVLDETEGIDLAVAHRRLELAAKRLPYSGSTFARAAFITVVALVIHYALAPIALLIASATGHSLPSVGSGVFESARFWARALALLTGGAVWAWWEWSWRRVLRFRRRYTRSAETLIRGSVREHIRRRRIWVLEQLIEHVGDDRCEPGTIRAWARSLADAAASLEAIALDADQPTLARDLNRWSVVVEVEPDSGAQDPRDLDERFTDIVRAMAESPVDADPESIVGRALDSLRAKRATDSEAFAAAFSEGLDRQEVIGAITGSCAATIPWLESFTPREPRPIHVLPEGLVVDATDSWSAHARDVYKALRSADRAFGALLWLTPLERTSGVLPEVPL